MILVDDIILRDGAVFVADSHFMRGDFSLLGFLDSISRSLPLGGQIFFMGDIFHLFIGTIPSSRRDNIDLINMIETLSKDYEIIFLEGNHDFGLQNLWENAVRYDSNFLDSKNVDLENKNLEQKQVFEYERDPSAFLQKPQDDGEKIQNDVELQNLDSKNENEKTQNIDSKII